MYIIALDLSDGQVKRFQARTGRTWAMVTGATGGIGFEFARQLSAKGYDIIIVGRRQEALDQVAEEIGMASSVLALMSRTKVWSASEDHQCGRITTRLSSESLRRDQVNVDGLGLGCSR